MMYDYGVRYLAADQFVRYCSDLNVRTDSQELEYYEKTGVMLPVARVIYPEDYVRLRTLWPYGQGNEPPKLEQWPELIRLFDKPRVLPEDQADLQDEELIDPFDREMGQNPYLFRPKPETFTPWDNYTVLVPYQDEQHLSGSTADHYYGYWQAHQLYYIHQFPDLYENKALLDHISDEIKHRIFRPWAPSPEVLREFKGMARMYDALSFWITMYNREQKRTFALVPEKHRVKHLDSLQLQSYRERLAAAVTLVQARYNMTVDNLYEFLSQLLALDADYRRNERHKLSDELRNDIMYEARFIGTLSGVEWMVIADELGKRYAFWTKQHFRHLNVLIRERDETHDLLSHYAGKYNDVLSELGISNPRRAFSTSDIDELLDYCEREGLSVLLTALSGMTATEDEYAKKFRRVSLYTNLKNALTALEFLLKDLAGKGHLTIDGSGLNAAIGSVMSNETGWISLFIAKKSFTRANDSAEFFAKLNQLIRDPNLVQSEDTYWARIFLIASLARNLTVHEYPDDDWFYGELFGEMLRAAIYAVLYSWQIAKRERWV